MKEDFARFLKENAGFKITGMVLGILFSPAPLFFLINALWGEGLCTALFHELGCLIIIFFLVALFINALVGAYFGNAFGESIKNEGTSLAIWEGVAGGSAIGIITGVTIGIGIVVILPIIEDFDGYPSESIFILNVFIYAITGLLIGAFVGLILALMTALFWHLFIKYI